ncbi:MAG: TlpA disulfide reductase family protein [Actinomycetes bacterium]
MSIRNARLARPRRSQETSTMYPNISRTRVRIAAASIVAASVLAACGSSDSEEADGAPAAVSATTEAMADDMADDEMADDMADDDMADDMADDDMADPTATTEAMADDEMADDEMADDEMADDMADDMADEVALAEWQTITLTDVDGVSFTLADFRGTPVFVETFATWCPKCKDQLEATNAAAEQVGDQAVFIAVSVETGLSNGDVADYAAANGFDAVRFAVLTPEALAAFVDGLGQSEANPPSTPKVVIDAMGAAGELSTGFESAEDIVAKVTGQV